MIYDTKLTFRKTDLMKEGGKFLKGEISALIASRMMVEFFCLFLFLGARNSSKESPFQWRQRVSVDSWFWTPVTPMVWCSCSACSVALPKAVWPFFPSAATGATANLHLLSGVSRPLFWTITCCQSPAPKPLRNETHGKVSRSFTGCFRLLYWTAEPMPRGVHWKVPGSVSKPSIRWVTL